MKILIPTILRFLHNMGTVMWIGSLFFITFILNPALKKIGDPKKTMEVGQSIYKKLTTIMIITIIIVILSGLPLANKNPHFQGLFNFSNNYSTLLSIKVLFAILMVLIVITKKVTQKKFYETKDNKYNKISNLCTTLNFWIGTIVVFLSSMLVYMK